MSLALIRFAFLCTLLSVSNPALAEEKGAAAGAITGGIAGALVGGPVGAIIGAGIGGVAGGALTSPAAVQVEQPSCEERGWRVRPSALAVFKFSTRLKRVGCSIGSSPVGTPRKMRST